MKDNAWAQDCQRCPAHSPLPVGTKQIQTCTKLLHLLCKICHPWAEWCHLKVPLWGQTAATADEVPAHDSMDHTIALLPKYPLPRGSMARKAAGNRQPSAFPTHPQWDVGPAYFPMGGFPVASPYLLFGLPAMPLQLPHALQAKVFQLGALGENRTE